MMGDQSVTFRHVETLTDLCQTEDVSEVQLVSLLEEHIPKYTLRADKLTTFSGYDNEDWIIGYPCMQASEQDSTEALPLDLLEESLKYIVSGGLRVSHMSRAYNDVRAVSLLLEEKERDLELTVSIGQTLVQMLKQLQKKVQQLTDQLKENQDEIVSLKSDRRLQETLLRFYESDFESESDEEAETQSNLPRRSTCSYRRQSIDISAIKARIRRLERDNEKMAVDAAKLREDTDECEQREDRLVEECVEHVFQTNFFIQCLQADVEEKTEVNDHHEERIKQCLETIDELHEKNYQLNVKLNTSLKSLEEWQSMKEIANAEASEWKEKYEECRNLLKETQEEVRNLRKAKAPTSVIQRHYNDSVFTPFLPSGSLASELQEFQKKSCLYPLGFSPAARKTHSRKVMDVARAVQRVVSKKNLLESYSDSPIPSDDREYLKSDDDADDEFDRASLKSICGSDEHSLSSSLECLVDEDDMPNLNQFGSGNYRDLGQPGLPGSNDLEAVLKRRTASLRSSITCPQFPRFDYNSNTNSQRSSISRADSTALLPVADDKVLTGCSSVVFNFSETGISPPSTPKSASCSSNNSGSTESLVSMTSVSIADVPQKLQIIKPIQGSNTLHRWQNLATPKLDGFFDVPYGIQTKGQPLINYFEDETYSFSDFEDDSLPVPSDCSSSIIPSPSSNCDNPVFRRTSEEQTTTLSEPSLARFYCESDVDGECRRRKNTVAKENAPPLRNVDIDSYFRKKQNQLSPENRRPPPRTLSASDLVKAIQPYSCSIM